MARHHVGIGGEEALADVEQCLTRATKQLLLPMTLPEMLRPERKLVYRRATATRRQGEFLFP